MEKSWVRSAHSMAPAATTAPPRASRAKRLPVLSRRGSRRRRPAPRVATPSTAAENPRVIPANPSAALMTSRPRGRLHVGRLVLGAVPDHDPVGGELVALPAALAHHRDPVAEELGGVAPVEHGGGLVAVGDRETDALGVLD